LSNSPWRLLRTGAASGALNMAVDEAILDSVAAGSSPPTLRLFTWQPACLSLGYFQPLAEVDVAQCARRGIDVVRRPTGGSAILHDRELTYSLAAPQTDPHLQGDLLTSYRSIAAVLVRALRDLGAEVTLAPTPSDGQPETGPRQPSEAHRRDRPVPCFVRPAGYEILAHGKKLVGSAQVRRGSALLQHGAIPLDGDVAAICPLLAQPPSEQEQTAVQLRLSATTLSRAAGRTVTVEEAARAIAAAFIAVWQVALEPADLSPQERLTAERLVQDKYANQAWTGSR